MSMKPPRRDTGCVGRVHRPEPTSLWPIFVIAVIAVMFVMVSATVSGRVVEGRIVGIDQYTVLAGFGSETEWAITLDNGHIIKADSDHNPFNLHVGQNVRATYGFGGLEKLEVIG